MQALILRLENLKRLPYGTWDKLKAEGFKVRKAQEILRIDASSAVTETMPRQYLTMAVYAFKKGLISEGELARYLRVDRLTAREQVDKYSDQIHSEEEEFTHYTSDLGRRLAGS